MSNHLVYLEDTMSEGYKEKMNNDTPSNVTYNSLLDGRRQEILHDEQRLHLLQQEEGDQIRAQIRQQQNLQREEHIFGDSIQKQDPATSREFYIPASMLSSLVGTDKRGFDASSELMDDDTMSAVAAAATFVNDVPNKRGLDQTFEMDHYSRKKHPNHSSRADIEFDDSQLVNHSNINIQLDTLSSFNLPPNLEDPTFNDISLNSSGRNSIVEPQKSKVIKFTPNRTSQNIKKPHLMLANPHTKKAKRDLKGPPKNSRFYKVYNSDGSKNQKPSSTHHYNPYRYPQNRSKLNPYPDFIRNRKDDTTTSETASLSGRTIAAAGSLPSHERLLSIVDDVDLKIPVLKPTIDEFEDIYAYIDSIKELGEEYGAVKIIPPKEFAPKVAINLESFWIKSNRQLWKSPSDEINARCEFYKQLKESLNRKGISLNKLPCIDKRAIDLYRLFKVVNLRGGFKNCCNDKLWAQIGRELGFYGKISSSLSSSIKSVYQKYLISWEAEYHESGQDFLNLVRNDDKYSLFTRAEYEENFPHVPIILGSSTSYVRNRKMLADAGFPTYYDQATTQKRGITIADSSTLSGYDFYDWLSSESAEDTMPTELKISSLYTLKQFYDKSRILKNQILNKVNEYEHYKFENLNYLDDMFWKLLYSRDIMFETEVALHQSTTIHDSSYENKFISDKNGNLSDTILGSLNFNNSTIMDDSLLQYVDSYNDSIYHSYLNFCMFYGSQSWTMEDHWFYKLDYHYLGDAKSVYVIPPSYQEKYEKLLENHLPSRNKINERGFETLQRFEKSILNYDIYSACLENQVCYDVNVPRSKPNDPNFRSFFDDQQIPPRYNNDIIFSPKFLRDKGIPVYHTFQDVGEMVIKFPKAYSLYFSLGTCVSESVNLATPDWLKHSLDASKWLQKQEIIPQFSTFAMLLTAAYESNNFKVLKSVKPVLENAVRTELEKRSRICKFMKELKLNGDYNFKRSLYQLKTKINKQNVVESRTETLCHIIAEKLTALNLVTDMDVADIFPSFVLISNLKSKKSNFILSLDSYLNLKENKRFKFEDFGCQMVSFVSDSYLKQTVKFVESKLQSPKEWLQKYHEFLSNFSRPPLSKVMPLLEEGNTALNNVSFDQESEDFKVAFSEFKTLQRYAERTAEWKRKAEYYLKPRKIMLPLSELQHLVGEIKKLMVSTEEEEKAILSLAVRVRNFDSEAILEIERGKDNMDFEKLKALHSEGLKINIELNSFKVIDKIVQRRMWLNNAIKDDTSFEELKQVYEQGRYLNLSNANDKRVLESLKQKIEKSEEVYSKFEILKKDDETVSHVTLLEIDSLSSDLPLPDVKRYIRNLINEYKHISEIIIPLIGSIREKMLLVASSFSFSKSVSIYLQFGEQIGKQLSSINVGLTLKTLSKFEEFQEESKLFKEQLIDGPSSVSSELTDIFNQLVNCYREKFKINIMDESDALNHLVTYDTDIINSNDERYCICRQSFEGSMVECENCQQWFHFGCIGYMEASHSLNMLSNEEDNGKYICPLCDIEDKLPNTKKFRATIASKLTFESLFSLAQRIIEQTCIMMSNENAFLQVMQKYYELYNNILLTGSIKLTRENGVNSYIIPEDPVKVRQLLQKLDGCLVNFDDLQRTLYRKHKELLTASISDAHRFTLTNGTVHSEEAINGPVKVMTDPPVCSTAPPFV